MIPSLSELKIRRRSAGLTQQGLAKESGMSQSLIAKIESGKISPGFEKVRQLFDCLDKLHEENSINAGKAMRRHVFFVSPKESVKEAVLLMEKHGISQLPVLEHEKPVGTLTEKSILAMLSKSPETVNLAKTRVARIMEEAMPTIQENTPIKIVSAMLSFNPAVLVSAKGKISGIITKADLLKIATKGK